MADGTEAGHPIMVAITTATSAIMAAGVRLTMQGGVILTTTTTAGITAGDRQIITPAGEVLATTTAAGITAVVL